MLTAQFTPTSTSDVLVALFMFQPDTAELRIESSKKLFKPGEVLVLYLARDGESVEWRRVPIHEISGWNRRKLQIPGGRDELVEFEVTRVVPTSDGAQMLHIAILDFDREWN